MNAARSSEATEALARLSRRVADHAIAVRREYQTLAAASLLMARHRVSMFEDAVSEEAKQRALREYWLDSTAARIE